MKHLKDLNIKNKTLLIRFDYNVPLQDNKILNDFRIKLNYILFQFSIETLHKYLKTK